MKLELIDTTLRDGHQSLWATRMTTAMMLPIVPTIDRVGYRMIDLMGSVQFDACVRYLREDPWERIQLVRAAAPNTTLGAGFRSEGLTGFDIVPDALVCLWIERLVANGIGEVMVLESLHDWNNIKAFADTVRKSGARLKIPMVYTESPVHTDEYYRLRTRELMKTLKPEVVYIKDANGVITPERVKTLVPALQAELGNTPLELHSHCTTGLAPAAYAEAMKLGVQTLHTAVPPLANGASQPPAFNVINNARRLGFDVDLNIEAIEAESKHFHFVASREGKPAGKLVEYDVFQYKHQIPGGMISNLEFMLAERGLADRLDEVLEEISRIREEWGYPIMVTPFSQILGTQAVLHVVTGERYSMTTRETIMYMRELYGAPPAPIDPSVKDRVLSLPEAREMLNWTPPQPTAKEIKKRMGLTDMSDDEFLLRALFSGEHVDAMIAAGPMNTDYPRGDMPLMALIETLIKDKRPGHFSLSKGGFGLNMKKKAMS